MARAELKRAMKAKREAPGEVLLAPAPEMHTMKIIDLLLGAPKIGRVKATKMLKEAQTSPSRTLGGLTDRQRLELARHFSVPAGAKAFLARAREAAEA